MTWQTTYPTLATVMQAGLQTLMTWEERLPAPQTDVERTIRRRIRSQAVAIGTAELGRAAPEIADTLDALTKRVEALIGKAVRP